MPMHAARALLILGLSVLAGCAGLQTGAPSVDGSAADRFAAVKDSPVQLHMFLQRFPKGGDLHNHLSGAVYAEDFIDWGLANGVCFHLASLSATPPPCDARAGRPLLRKAFADGAITRDAVIDAWSLRNFVPGHSAPSGHAQFFGTFGRFNAASDDQGGQMLAEVVRHAADQNIVYLELMASPQMSAARALARKVGPQPDLDALYDALMAAGIETLVPKASAGYADMVAAKDRRFGCPASADPACEVEVRFLAQVIRTFPPEQIFAQSLLGFLLIEADPQVVGLNLVAPEDDALALATYDAQMQQLGYLAERRGPQAVTLHAGELTLGLVHPRHLRSHIRQAVEVAGARRIGHGVDIAYEHDAERLLQHMAREEIAVEINLTSNEQILGVSGDEHPFDTYRAYGVPLTISTDDEGVSRGSLTHEYQRAVQTYDLSYADILAFSRNALSYAFLDGRSLWADNRAFTPVAECTGERLGGPSPDAECAAFLQENEKADLQWRLEARIAAFEADPAGVDR